MLDQITGTVMGTSIVLDDDVGATLSSQVVTFTVYLESGTIVTVGATCWYPWAYGDMFLHIVHL
jgi:hypothetical protein